MFALEGEPVGLTRGKQNQRGDQHRHRRDRGEGRCDHLGDEPPAAGAPG